MEKPMIKFEHVSKSYKDQKIINDLNIEIMPGEMFVLVGTSGSGKTTTMKMVNKLTDISQGSIYVDNQNINDYSLVDLRWKCGYVLQQIALFPNMTVGKNISIVPELKHEPVEQTEQTVNDLLKEVGLDESYKNRMPSDLSGGEQQRVGIMRALAAKPKIILFDEPFSALDPIVKDTLENLVLEMHEKYHTTVMFVTHDMDEAMKLGDRIGVMVHGELIQVDTPENIKQHPANEFVRQFFQKTTTDKMFETNAQQILEEGYGTIVEELITANRLKMPILNEKATLKDLLRNLSVHEYVKIVNDQQQEVGYLSEKSVIQFLSSH